MWNALLAASVQRDYQVDEIFPVSDWPVAAADQWNRSGAGVLHDDFLGNSTCNRRRLIVELSFFSESCNEWIDDQNDRFDQQSFHHNSFSGCRSLETRQTSFQVMVKQESVPAKGRGGKIDQEISGVQHRGQVFSLDLPMPAWYE